MRAIRRAGVRVVELHLNRSLLDYVRRRTLCLALVQSPALMWPERLIAHGPQHHQFICLKYLCSRELRSPWEADRIWGFFAATFLHGPGALGRHDTERLDSRPIHQ